MAAVAMKRDMGDMMRSREYYVTPEVYGQLRHIEDAVDHIRLDNELLRTSDTLRGRCDERTLKAEKAAAEAVTGRGSMSMAQVKKHMTAENVSQLQDNQVRQLHHWTTSTLGSINQDIGPFADRSKDRIRQFCDDVGVTDRYTGYRNNLSRCNQDPVRIAFQWLDTKPNAYNRSLNVAPGHTMRSAPMTSRMPPTCTGASGPFTTKQTSGTIQSLNIQHSATTMQRPVSTASIQEQCGINTTFPGRTEYMTRYQRPPLDRPTRAFTINPTPDFGIYGRPLMRQEFSPNNTEYQARYEWPDGSRITKLPWLKN